MGTDKRARQKAGRQARLEALQQTQTKTKRNRTAIRVGIGVAAVLLLALLWSVLGGDDDDGGDEVVAGAPTTVAADPTATTAPAPGEPFAYGTGACAPEGGAAERTASFGAAPQLCIDPARSYTATFVTDRGDITVALDTTRTPGTTNNFVTLARHRYYDDTVIFRSNDAIDILQGGGRTNTDSPGYTIPDEGGSFTYEPGQLVMARTSQPDSAGGQFFFVTGEGASSLDGQGTYVVFGQVVEGMDVVEAIAASHKATPNALPGEGRPDPEVVIETVTISES